MIANLSSIINGPMFVSKFVMIKIFLNTILSVAFSPLSVIFMLMFSFGLAYIVCTMMHNMNTSSSNKKSRNIVIKKFFIKNKFVVSALFLIALAINIKSNTPELIRLSNIEIAEYSNICIVIPEKMLDMNISDELIKDAMGKSGCNADAFDTLKALWHMTPKLPPPLKYYHNQYGYPMQGDA